MKENSTLRSLCSVNDDKLVMRDISGVDDERMEARLIKDHIFDRKYFEFDDYLKIHEVSVSVGIQEEFNKAIYGNYMLNFLSNYRKLLPTFHGSRSDEFVLAPYIKSNRLIFHARRLIKTLNHLSTHDCNNRIKISRNYQLRYLSHK